MSSWFCCAPCCAWVALLVLVCCSPFVWLLFLFLVAFPPPAVCLVWCPGPSPLLHPSTKNQGHRGVQTRAKNSMSRPLVNDPTFFGLIELKSRGQKRRMAHVKAKSLETNTNNTMTKSFANKFRMFSSIVLNNDGDNDESLPP